MSTPLTTWWLEMTAPDELRAAPEPPADAGITVERAEAPSPEFGRFLYTAVGSDVSWVDRLGWPPEQWRAVLGQPGHELWVAYVRGTPAGFLELGAGDPGEGSVEIVYFGLLPDFRGRGLGGHLLSYGTARGWDLAERRPEHPPTRRVWLHTCSLDGPHARRNYERRGFRRYDTVVEPATVATAATAE